VFVCVTCFSCLGLRLQLPLLHHDQAGQPALPAGGGVVLGVCLRVWPVSLSAAARTLPTLAIQIRAELRVRLVKRGQRTEPRISSCLFSVHCGSSFTALIHTAGIRDRFPPCSCRTTTPISASISRPSWATRTTCQRSASR